MREVRNFPIETSNLKILYLKYDDILNFYLFLK